MDFIIDSINKWITDLLIDGIIFNYSGMFDIINDYVGVVASEVEKTPSSWNVSVFSFIQNLSQTVILPIAGLILTFVMCHELISMIIDRNNLHDFQPSEIFKWLIKTCLSVLILTNVFDIVFAIFDVSSFVVKQSTGVIFNDTSIDVSTAISNLESVLETMDMAGLLGLYMQSVVMSLASVAMYLIIFVVIYGRMIEIYMITSLAPIPFSTLGNKEIGSIGQNYIKSILALAFQAFLIMVCVGIYATLINDITTSSDPLGAVTLAIAYTVLLCFTLLKTISISKSIFGAH